MGSSPVACNIFSKLKILGISKVNDIGLMPLLLTLNRFNSLFFYPQPTSYLFSYLLQCSSEFCNICYNILEKIEITGKKGKKWLNLWVKLTTIILFARCSSSTYSQSVVAKKWKCPIWRCMSIKIELNLKYNTTCKNITEELQFFFLKKYVNAN